MEILSSSMVLFRLRRISFWLKAGLTVCLLLMALIPQGPFAKDYRFLPV